MGVCLPNLPAKELLDTNVLLPTAGVSRFTLEGKTFSFPTFENAEQLVNQLAKQDSIRRDPLRAKHCRASQHKRSKCL